MLLAFFLPIVCGSSISKYFPLHLSERSAQISEHYGILSVGTNVGTEDE